MLLNHPNIERVRCHEQLRGNGKKDNTLIIETNLKLPQPGTHRQHEDFDSLIEYLTSLSDSEFHNFDKLEIREFKAYSPDTSCKQSA